MKPVVRDGVETLKDRYVPRFEVFFAKPQPSEARTPVSNAGPIDPVVALAEEKAKLDDQIYKVTGAPNQQPPTVSQLLPLAGPWGEKAQNRTDDILSVEVTESVEKKQPLTQLKVELLNVYDPITQRYRYTDLEPGSQLPNGVFPLIEYGDKLALRVGYGAKLEWMFSGVVTTVNVDFPADGESKVSITAVDNRDRLRSKKKLETKTFGGASEEEVIAQIARQVGLRVAAPPGQVTTSKDAKKSRPKDQDALQYITDRANKASLELLCFGDTLFVYKPGDDAASALLYEYRRGLTSFSPQFNGAGKPTRVRVESRNPETGEEIVAEVGSKDLEEAGLAPPSEEGTALDKVEQDGGSGERLEVVTNYLASTEQEARTIAVGILKRNLDETITADGTVIGDPRIRARETLSIRGVGRFSGLYYVTSSTHRLGENGYQTLFKLRRNTAFQLAPTNE